MRHFARMLVLLLLCAAPLAAVAQPSRQPPSAEAAAPALPPTAVTRHVLTLPDRTLRFTATTGVITVPDPETGKPAAEIGTIAYTLDGADPRTRPVLFALNGGPGFASAWLQLGAIGPWRIRMDSVPSAPPAPIPNADTWLDFTDLVFIDPAGTGYSAFLDQDARQHFWTVEGDIDSLAETVRGWLEAHGRIVSPKFLVGESYGGFRAARLGWTLPARQGIGVSGLILVSPVLDFGDRGSVFDPLGWALSLPSRVAVARAAKGAVREQDLADAEQYALGDFLRDQLRGDADTDAMARIEARVAALTGLDPALVARDHGRIPTAEFLRSVAPGRIASAYDATITAPEADPTNPYAYEPDPVLERLYTPFSSAMLELYTQRLNWHPNAPYRLQNREVTRRWNWGHGLHAPEAVTALRRALSTDPHVHVLVGAGLYDLVAPYFATKTLLAALPQSEPPGRLRFVAYAGGHMFYAGDAARGAFRAEAAALIGK